MVRRSIQERALKLTGEASRSSVPSSTQVDS